jgi:tetratricopeptide (TPR) repeat protein
MVYFDYDAVIFLKDIPRNRRWIEQFAVDLENRQAPEADLARLGSRKVIPYRYVNRAHTLEALDFNDQALAELKEATRIAPNYIAPYKLKGKIHAEKENFQESFENFRIAAMLSPTILNKTNLASAYEKLGDFDHAIAQIEGVIKRNPKNPRGYFYLARVYAKANRDEAALYALGEAHERDPGNMTDFLAVGDILYEQGAYYRAKEVFEYALTIDPDSAVIREKLEMTLKQLGRISETLKSLP